MIFRVSLALVVAVVTTTVAASKKKHSSSVDDHSEKNGSNCKLGRGREASTDVHLEREMEEETLEPNSHGIGEIDVCVKEKEAEMVRYLAKEYRQREVALERRSLELDGLKQREVYVAHLQKKLQEKAKEVARLNATVSSMRAESVALRNEINEGSITERQLQMAKEVMGTLQRKMDANASRVKGHLAMLQEQVLGLETKGSSSVGAEIDEKVKDSKRAELEIFKVKRKNKELELERRELVVKLVAAKARVAAISKIPETEVVAKAREEMSNLKQANEEILKQIETLQKSRFIMVEELVYQRWLNTCMRLQLQDYQTPRRPSRINHNRVSEMNQLIAGTESGSCPSSATSSTKSRKSSSFSSIGTATSTSNSQRSKSKKPGLIRSIKNWGRSKDEYSAGTVPSLSKGSPWQKGGPVRRFSMSMVPSKPAPMPSDEFTNSPRIRRVSFDDHVRVVTLDFEEEPPTPAESESTDGDHQSETCDHNLEEKVMIKSPLHEARIPDKYPETRLFRPKEETIDGAGNQETLRVCNANAQLEKEENSLGIEGVSKQEGHDLDKVKIHSTVHFVGCLFLVLFLLLLVRFLLSAYF